MSRGAPLRLRVKPFLAASLLCVFALNPASLFAATNDLSSALQRGLFEEEANRNLDAAAQAYQTVSAQFDKDRKLAATAIFRLGEVYRKQNKTNEAVAQYERIVREFSDQETLVTLSRQNLAGLGAKRETTRPVASTGVDVAKLKALSHDELLQVLPTIAPDPLLTQLLSQRQSAEVELVKLGSQYGSDHPAIVTMESTLVKLDQQIAKRVQGILTALEMRGVPSERSAMGKDLLQVSDPEEEEIRRLQTLIQNSPDLINGPAKGDSPLYTAAGEGRLRAATFLLDNGADVNKPSNGRTPLHQAAQSGHKAMVELLLQRGANVNARDARRSNALTGGSNTALHLAAADGYLSIAELLVKYKADLDARNSHNDGGQSPLHLAAGNGHAALVKFLIANGDDPNRKDTSGNTPLHLVAERGRDGTIELLLKSGANVNATNNSGMTPLMYAANNGHLLSVKALLSAKANLDLFDSRGRTALSYAVGPGHSEVVNALLDAKADVNAGTADSPLLLAMRADNAALAERLLRAGADPNRVTDSAAVGPFISSGQQRIQRTPLQAAVLENHPAMAGLLMQFKGDAKATDDDGSPLILRTLVNAELLRAFLEAGADPNASDGVGRFAIVMAAFAGNAASVELLLKHGANANVQDQDGKTALHYAAANSHREMAEVLLAHKAEVNVRDKAGKTPLDYAKMMQPQVKVAAGASSSSAGVGSVHTISGTLVSSRLPPSQTGWESRFAEVVALLRKHGALDELPDFTAIRVTRQGIGQPYVVFTAAEKSTNQFTLLETVLWFYRKPPTAMAGRIYSGKDDFPFPDLGNIIIHRPGRSPGDAEQEIKVSLLNSNNVLDCAKDVPVHFGDVIEIPERVHALNEVSTDPATEVERIFMEADRRTLPVRALREPEVVSANTNSVIGVIRLAEAARAAEAERLACLRKTIELTAAGQTTTLTLDFWKVAGFLRFALGRPEARAVLRSSSDLSRVKVTRKDSVTGKPVVLIVDAAKSLPRDNDLWLQDGDVIEVPDRP